MSNFKKTLRAIISWWHVTLSGRLWRTSPLLSIAWSDGLYLTAWPLAAILLPLAAFLSGLGFGFFHPNWFITGDGLFFSAPPVQTNFTIISFFQMVPLVFVAVACGSMSAQLGLLVVLGFALGDQLNADFLSSFTIGRHDWGWRLVHLRLPQVVTYIFFAMLAAQSVLLSQALAASLNRITSRRAMTIVTAIVMAVIVYAWTFAAPMIGRVIWLWMGGWNSPVIVPYYISVVDPWLPLLAAVLILLRGWLTHIASRNALALQSAERLSAAIDAARAAPALTERQPPWAVAVFTALLITLLTSGLYLSFWPRGAEMFAVIAALLVARASLLPRIPLWSAWASLMRRIPLLVRWIALGLGGYAVSWSLIAGAGQTRHLTNDTGAFGALLVTIVLGVALTVILFPADTNGGAGRPFSKDAAAKIRRAAPVACAVLFIVMMFAPATAFATCEAPNCCFRFSTYAAFVGQMMILALASLPLILMEGILGPGKPPSDPGYYGGGIRG